MAAIVGRDRELALAGRFLEHAQQRAAALVLLGEPGIGKTTVWEEVARRASAQNFRVLAARPAEAEARLALSAVADLFARVSQEALEALPPPQRRALDVAAVAAGALATSVFAVPRTTQDVAGSVPLRVALHWSGRPVPCAQGVPPTVVCHAHPSGYSAVAGVGFVSQHYVYPVETVPSACPGGSPCCRTRLG